MVRHVDAIGKTDQSLIAITMTGRITNAPSTSGLKVNLKAQSWWALRARFQATYRAVVEKLDYDADELISISPNLPNLSALLVELSQPTYSINTVGKVLIDKKPDGTKSPNLADAVMICYQPGRRWMETWFKL